MDLRQIHDDLLQVVIQLKQLNGSETSSAPAATFTSSSVNTSGSVTAGKRSVTFSTSSDYTGTINGVARDASFAYVFDAKVGLTPAIAYTVTTGSITIDILS